MRQRLPKKYIPPGGVGGKANEGVPFSRIGWGNVVFLHNRGWGYDFLKLSIYCADHCVYITIRNFI